MFKKLVSVSVFVALFAAIPLGSVSPVLAHSSCGASVRVQPGDTLFRIGARCGVSAGEILRANPRLSNPNYIQLGMTLLLPGRTGTSQPVPPAAPVSGSYTIRRGDTLSIIARRFDVSLHALMAANRHLGNPNYLRVGAVIRIPGRGASGAPAYPSPPNVPKSITVTGTLTGEGVECQVMRGDDGKLYTLVGDVFAGRSGERVQVLANRVQRSICQQGTTLEVLKVRRLGQPVPPPPSETVSIFGTLTDEGVECQALRDYSGRLYTLTGDTGPFFEGDAVHVEGRIAEFSFCQQGTTIDVQVIEEVQG